MRQVYTAVIALAIAVTGCNVVDATSPSAVPGKVPVQAAQVIPNCQVYAGYNFERRTYFGCVDGLDGNIDVFYNGSSFGVYDLIHITWTGPMTRFLNDFASGDLKPPYDGAEYTNIRTGKSVFGSGFLLKARLVWDARCAGIHIPEIVCLDANFLIDKEFVSDASNNFGWVVKPGKW